ncbi:MAG: FecR domain-containing protein, partial [Alphaproteobacteria bacterium]|nr:FecR domain-containing protein [Alphaproteobacteria bacterium]
DPFTVTAGDAIVQVVGTRFDVDLLPARTQVSVAEGAVRVRSPEGGAGVLLRGGQQVQVREGRVGSAAAVDTMLALSWMEGRISVEDARLADLAAMLGRYADGRVMVIGAAGERRVSGPFPVTDIATSLETVAEATGVRLVTAGPWLTVLY